MQQSSANLQKQKKKTKGLPRWIHPPVVNIFLVHLYTFVHSVALPAHPRFCWIFHNLSRFPSLSRLRASRLYAELTKLGARKPAKLKRNVTIDTIVTWSFFACFWTQRSSGITFVYSVRSTYVILKRVHVHHICPVQPCMILFVLRPGSLRVTDMCGGGTSLDSYLLCWLGLDRQVCSYIWGYRNIVNKRCPLKLTYSRLMWLVKSTIADAIMCINIPRIFLDDSWCSRVLSQILCFVFARQSVVEEAGKEMLQNQNWGWRQGRSRGQIWYDLMSICSICSICLVFWAWLKQRQHTASLNDSVWSSMEEVWLTELLIRKISCTKSHNANQQIQQWSLRIRWHAWLS